MSKLGAWTLVIMAAIVCTVLTLVVQSGDNDSVKREVAEIHALAVVQGEQITAILAQMSILYTELSRSGVPHQPQRIPVGEADRRLEEQFTALSDKLDSIGTSLSEIRAAVGSFDLSAEEFDSHPTNYTSLSQLPTLSEKDLAFGHHGWGLRKVLQVYGRPDRVDWTGDHSGIQWFYQLPNKILVQFIFLDQRVARVNIWNE